MSWYLKYESSSCLSEREKMFLYDFKTEGCFVDYITERISKDWFLQKDRITLIDILKGLDYD